MTVNIWIIVLAVVSSGLAIGAELWMCFGNPRVSEFWGRRGDKSLL